MDGRKEEGGRVGERYCEICSTNLCIPWQSSQHVQDFVLQSHEPLPTQGSTKMDTGTAPRADCRVVHSSCSLVSAMYP